MGTRRVKRISKQQENRAASDLGGRVQAASGATRLGGGADVRVQGKIRVECKVTEKNSYIVKREELLKLSRQAMKTLEIPVFQFAFRSNLGRLDKYAIISPSDKIDNREPFHLDTGYGSLNLTQQYLQASLRHGPILLTFRDGAFAFMWEVITWTDFLKRNGEVDV